MSFSSHVRVAAVFAAVMTASPVLARGVEVRIEIAAGEHDRMNVPVKALVRLPRALERVEVAALSEDEYEIDVDKPLDLR